MAEPKYRDLLITDDDITLDAGGYPVLVTERACIAQDIQHMIRESGLLVDLVGERTCASAKPISSSSPWRWTRITASGPAPPA